jgi:hypothetical protein
MATVSPLSIDIAGVWSFRQADAVIAALAPELDARGLELAKIDITTLGEWAPRCLLVARCGSCHHVIEAGEACRCSVCLCSVHPRSET